MADIYTEEDLLELLSANNSENRKLDPSEIKYALYTRKSTQGDEQQERSIEDQITECMSSVIIPNKLNVVETIEEKFSAKEPGTRKKFKALMEQIREGKITGLIAWHPDRLARNMKDAGEVIDLLDTGILKDLRFATSTFENNPTGKMMLGISFVLSKQYSEHLSESVTRGNRLATEEDGIYLGKLKHGYYIDTDRFLRPDDNTFTVVQEMFNMRLKGSTQKDIADWANKRDYKVRRRGGEPLPFKWEKDDVSKLLRDPAYAGVLKYGEHTVVLKTKYDFIPMIDVDDFLKINNIASLESSKVLSIQKKMGSDIRANLLRGIVFCGACNKPLTSMIIDKRRDGAIYESRYYYKCETEGCQMCGKSARAKFVLDKAFQPFLDMHNNGLLERSSHEEVMRRVKKALKEKNKELSSELVSQRSKISKLQSEYETTKSFLLRNEQASKHYNLDSLDKSVKDAEVVYAKLKVQLEAQKDVILKYEEYLKLFRAIPVILSNIRYMSVMDELLRFFYLNFTIHPNNGSFRKGLEVTFKLKEPWEGLLKYDKIVNGAG